MHVTKGLYSRLSEHMHTGKIQAFLDVVVAGFDLIDVGREEVLLITSKQVSRKVIHYTLQGLLAIFGKSSQHPHFAH